MEHNSSFDSFELQFTPVAQGFLRETAKWAKFLSIVGFVFIGFYVLIAFVMFAMGGAIGSQAGQMEGMQGMSGPIGLMGIGGAAMGVFYLICALLYFFPVLYLYRFASNAKQALLANNTQQLTASFENLKSHYKYIGILMLIMLVFVLLFAGIAVIGFSFMASAM
jgi:hypothetical protein